MVKFEQMAPTFLHICPDNGYLDHRALLHDHRGIIFSVFCTERGLSHPGVQQLMKHPSFISVQSESVKTIVRFKVFGTHQILLKLDLTSIMETLADHGFELFSSTTQREGIIEGVYNLNVMYAKV